MNRLVIWREECDAQGQVTLTGRRAEHIRTILKCTPGDTLRAGFANECMAVGTVLEVGMETCVVNVREAPDEPMPPPPRMDVLLALPRPRFLERILPQLPPLGVRNIYLCGADRVEKSFFGSQLLKRENYLPVLVEGVEQSGGVHVPGLRVERNLRRLLGDLPQDYACKLLAHPETEVAPTPSHVIASGAKQHPSTGGKLNVAAPLLVAIGCEGGWTERERAWMDEAGFARFSLGERILRTDTASVAILAVAGWMANAPQTMPFCHISPPP